MKTRVSEKEGLTGRELLIYDSEMEIYSRGGPREMEDKGKEVKDFFFFRKSRLEVGIKTNIARFTFSFLIRDSAPY